MLFPKPKKSEEYEGRYELKNDYTTLSVPEFYSFIKNDNCDVKINIDSSLKKEEYKISVNEYEIVACASCEEGIYRAATSLLQLIKKQGRLLNCCKIEDEPQLERRGYMLDISRCRMPKPDTIKEIIDFLTELKYNELQLYMEGGCFKYSEYPEYTEDFDCLTPEDIKDLEKYCNERFIDLVPNQNSFGHLAYWLRMDEFKHLGICENGKCGATVNPLHPESIDFVKGLYKSVLPHFKSEYVNIGLDEAFGLGRCQTESYCEEHGKDELFMQWLNKLNDVIHKEYGKKVQFWADMIYKYQDLYHKIPKDATILEWGYELIQSQQMTEHCIAFKNAGLRYYVCPSCNTHLSFTGRADVTSFNIRTSGELAAKYDAAGMLLTDWGNGEGHPHFWVWSAVPIALASQYAWNPGVEQDGESFKSDYIRNAESYVDDVLFKVKGVSRLLYRMANYYLLEPERVHCSTMCGGIFQRALNVTNFNHLFDLKDSGDSFYFDNVIEYVEKILADIEKLDFNLQLKREIILNSQMVILSAELCKVRIGCTPDADKVKSIVNLIDWIYDEYHTLWCMRNFQKGEEHFLGQLASRKKELLEMYSIK